MPFPRITLLIAIAGIALGGCGEKPNLVQLQGKVTYNGKPLEYGSVMLQPIQGGKYSRADIQPDGTFELTHSEGAEGATIGLNRIRVTCFPAQKPGTPRPVGEEIPLGKSLIPEVYNSFSSSELTVEVLPADNPPLLIELKD